MKGWKIVELVALVREDQASDLHAFYGRTTENDECTAAVITTRDLTTQEESDFSEVIAGAGSDD